MANMAPPTGRDDERRSIERELKRGIAGAHRPPPAGTRRGLRLRDRLEGDGRNQRRPRGHRGTLYPVLYRLERAGFVAVRWETPERGVPRKYYTLTESGREELSGSPRSGRRLPGRWRNCCDVEQNEEGCQMTIPPTTSSTACFEDADSDSETRADRDGAPRTHQRARERGRATRRGARAPRRPGSAGRVISVSRPPDRRRLLVACDRPSDRLRFAGGAAGPVACLIWFATPLEWVPVLLFIYAFVGGATIAIYPMVAEAKYGKTLASICAACAWSPSLACGSAPGRPSCATCPGCWRSGGSTRFLRCSPTGGSGRSRCCRRRVS